ncbi:MAG: hypothetical protein AAF960_11115 [Bacteroidota bacterium]
MQRRYIETALNIKEVGETTLDEVVAVLNKKLDAQAEQTTNYEKALLVANRVSAVCQNEVDKIIDVLENEQIKVISITNDPLAGEVHFPFQNQLINYSKLNGYHYDSKMPRNSVGLLLTLNAKMNYRILLLIHGYGFGKKTVAVGIILESQGVNADNQNWYAVPLDIPPHIISVEGIFEKQLKNIVKYTKDSLAIALAQVVNEI